MRQVMQARHPQLADLGLFLLVVALPLVFTPFSVSPFGDPKLVVLAAGTLALWTSGFPIDRRLCWAAAAWIVATVVAAFAGVDLAVGLTARTEGQGGGAIVIACAGLLAVLGGALPEDLRNRTRRWFVASSSVVAMLGLAIRVFPDLSSSLPSGMELIGATVGNQLFAAALMSAAIAAAIAGPRGDGVEDRPADVTAWTVALVAFLALGAATFGERSSIVLPIVAAAAALWRARFALRTTIVLASAVLVPLVAWQALDAVVFPDTLGRGAAVTGIAAQTTDLHRVTVWRAMTRAAAERPLLGWGPGSSKSAYLAAARPSEVALAGRQWSDAHNLFLETAVSSGVLGLAALVWLATLLSIRAFQASRERAWAFGAAAGLAAYSIVEPIGLVLTPLLFLFAGMAGGPGERSPDVDGDRAAWVPRSVSWGVALSLILATVVSLQMQAAASFERWGRTYGEPWALERALAIQPWRVSAAQRLALRRALDGRAGSASDAEAARDLIAAAVRRHPWDADVRFWAADVETLLRDETASRAWIEQQLRRFPGDAATVADPGRSDLEKPRSGA